MTSTRDDELRGALLRKGRRCRSKDGSTIALTRSIDDRPADIERQFDVLEADVATGRLDEALVRLRVLRLMIGSADRHEAAGYARGGMTPKQKRRVESYIEDALGTALTVAQLAEIAKLSSSHFCRTFRESFGQPPQAYIQARRVERAKRLMLATVDPIAIIADECGFADQSALCKVFRRFTGESPAFWRKRRRD